MNTSNQTNSLVKLYTKDLTKCQKSTFARIFAKELTFEQSLKHCDFLGKRVLKRVTSLKELKQQVKYFQASELLTKISAKRSEIETILSSPDLTTITINVERKKSKMWGYNPTVKVVVRSIEIHEHTIGTASGCGYDKESAAIAEALNQSSIVKKALYLLKAKKPNKPNRDLFGYDTEYGVLPSFEGGVGVSCYYRIFEAIGYKMEKTGWGDSFDTYSISKAPRKAAKRSKVAA